MLLIYKNKVMVGFVVGTRSGVLKELVFDPDPSKKKIVEFMKKENIHSFYFLKAFSFHKQVNTQDIIQCTTENM